MDDWFGFAQLMFGCVLIAAGVNSIVEGHPFFGGFIIACGFFGGLLIVLRKVFR